MNTTLLNRFQLELAMLHRIYRCTDEAELALLFEKVTGHSLDEWDKNGNVWQCDVPFEQLISADVGIALDFLADYWRKHEMKTNYLTRPQIALVLIGHIFEELDVHDIEELVTKVTCSEITFDEDATAKGDGEDLWQSEKPFTELADSSLPKLLDYLKDVLKR